MGLTLDPVQAATFVMASVRIMAFLIIAPPFAGAAVPSRVKVGLSVVLALLVTPRMTDTLAGVDTATVIGGIVYQALIGFSLGFIISILFAAVQAAGTLIDFGAGFSSAAAFDPFSQASATPIGRLYQMLATLLLFSTGGYLLFIGGILRSFDAAPMSGFDIGRVSATLTEGVANFFVAALQIAAPLMAALFMAELLLGLMAKAAPQMNLLVVGFGAKSMVVLGLGALALPLLPLAVSRLVDMALQGMGAMLS